MEKMEYTNRKIWMITYPVLISLLMQQMIGITDTAFLGRVGEVELGASALGGIYYLVIYMVGFGFSIGAEIVMGRRNGEGRHRDIGNIFTHGMIFLLGLAGLMFLLSMVLAPLILGKAISSEAVYQATMDYTRWRVFGFFFSFGAIMFRAYYMATTNTRILTINSLVMVMTNVLLNYILIFGKFGFPALGIAGAAIASSISEMVSLAFYYFYSRYRTDYRKYGLFRKVKMSWKVELEILRVAGWTMIQYFISCGTWLFFFFAIERLGERPLAISNMVRNLSAILYLFVSAFATTGSAMVSNLMGQNAQDKIMPLCWRLIKICALLTVPFMLLTAIFPGFLLRIYTDDAALIASAIPSLRIVLISYLFGIPGYVYFLAISGSGNTRAAFWIEMVVLSAYILYIYIVAVSLHADVQWVWIVESVYNFLLLIICKTYLDKANWQKKLV